MSSDPVHVAWSAEGSPAPVAGGRRSVGRCARCATREELETVSRVVSDRFTGYGDWADPSGKGLCASCAWAYRDPRLRTSAHVVRRHPTGLEFLDHAALGDLLQAPVTSNAAVVVLLGVGRKHALPSAQFGQVCLDGVPLTWSQADVDRLAAMARLRRAGVSYVALSESAPPWRVISDRAPQERQEIMRLWGELDPWRAARPWFDLGVTATTGAAGR